MPAVLVENAEAAWVLAVELVAVVPSVVGHHGDWVTLVIDMGLVLLSRELRPATVGANGGPALTADSGGSMRQNVPGLRIRCRSANLPAAARSAPLAARPPEPDQRHPKEDSAAGSGTGLGSV